MYKKNQTKSLEQKILLEQFYNVSAGGIWRRQDLEGIAQETGLTRQQVYKWLWDKRNIQKKKTDSQVKIEQEQPNLFSYSDCQEHEFTYNRCRIKVPVNLRRAVEFTVDPKVPSWAVTILKNEGWQFIKLVEGIEQDHILVDPTSAENEPFKYELQLGQIKQYDTPRSIIRCSRFEIVKQKEEENVPLFKNKFLDQAKEYLKRQDFSLKRSKSALSIQDKTGKTVKKNPVFSQRRKNNSQQVYEPSE